MADTNLDIKIRTTADTAGATAAAASLKGVEQATKGASAASGDFKKTVVDADKASREGAEAFEKLRNASNGGAAGIVNLARAVKALGAAFLANPVGVGIAAFLALRPAAEAAGKAFGDFIAKARGADFGSGADRAKAMGDALKGIKDAGEQSLEKIKTDAKIAADEFERLVKGITEAKNQLDTLADAATAAKLAEIDLAEAEALAGAGSESERVQLSANFNAQRRDVRSEAETQKQDREMTAELNKRGAATSLLSNAQSSIGSASGSVDDAKKALEQFNAANPSIDVSTASGRRLLDQRAVLQADIASKENALQDAKKTNSPIIDKASAQIRSSDTSLTALNDRRRASEFTNRAAETSAETARASSLQAARETDAKRSQELALGSVTSRFLSGRQGDLTADQEAQAAKRAIEINKNALALAGRQGGEEMGEALALAIKELIPTLTNAALVKIRDEFNSTAKNARTLQ